MAFVLVAFYFILFASLVCAQTISVDTPVPPLQWINLTGFLQGSANQPPPLKDAAIGYDETSRSILIFGGESENGFPQSKTYILDLLTLTWSSPSPPSNLATIQHTPPARSSVVAGVDFAASNRHGFVVVGGKGSDGSALSDVWEYDFINQFWSQVVVSPGGPSARWGASGGIDIRSSPVQDPVVPGPNNTFFMSGGFDGSKPISLSDVWKLELSGTLSSNLPDSARGSWEHLTIDGQFPGKVGQGGTVVSQLVVSVGGCNSTSASGDSCAQQDSYVIDTQRQSSISPGACPAPRLSPVLIPNLNTFTSSFASQVFMLLGIFNSSLWQDNQGLLNGEVAVLDTNTGTWSRILPAGDPGTSGKAQFPTPREGAVAVSYPQSLVGDARTNSADTIVFGGRDSSGKYLSEMWLLRAYAGAITPSSPKWSGFGDGQLQTGVNADGSGVSIEYMSQCASAIAQHSASTSAAAGTSTTPISTPTPSASSDPSTSTSTPTSEPLFEVSFLHKLLAPLSLAIFLPIIIFYRITSPFSRTCLPERHAAWVYASILFVFAVYGMGVGALILSFTTISKRAQLQKRTVDSVNILKTAHGRAGLAFFLCLYVFVPVIFVISAYSKDGRKPSGNSKSVSSDSPEPTYSVDTSEKPDIPRGHPRSPSHSVRDASPPASPRPRTLSWGPSSMWQRSHEGRLSSDSESAISAAPQRGFEVVNRPSRNRQVSTDAISPLSTRSLGDIDWLLRRRSLNAVNELDYAITQAHNAQFSANNTGDALVTPATTPPLSRRKPELPSTATTVLHIFLQGSILGLCVLTLSALWTHASRAIFVVFLVWTAIFYVALFTFSWRGRPKNSVLTVFLGRLRDNREEHTLEAPSTSFPQVLRDQQPSYPGHGPYAHHRPPYRAMPLSPDEISTTQGPRSTEPEEEEDDIDEETRQRMMEEEMGRRDVSIVTVPKRKLWIANPS